MELSLFTLTKGMLSMVLVKDDVSAENCLC